MKYYVYILLCNDHTFYTGWTTDLEKRVNTHNRGNGSKYTRGRLPVMLWWSWPYKSKSKAMKVEYKIKQWSHVAKSLIDRGPR